MVAVALVVTHVLSFLQQNKHDGGKILESVSSMLLFGPVACRKRYVNVGIQSMYMLSHFHMSGVHKLPDKYYIVASGWPLAVSLV